MMEQESEIKPPIKRYECANCGTIIDLPLDSEIDKQKCCKSPNYVLILFEDENRIRIEIGKCYEKIQEIIKTYMDMPEEQIKIVSLWIIGTYFHSAFNTYPYLFINAMRGSGKTRLLNLIAHLSCQSKGKVHTGANETLLFRTPKHHTLIFDEMESVGSKEKATFREYLNACYKIGGVVSRAKKVKTKEGEDFKLDEFEPYKPLAMANIWGMDDVLGDRCLTFILEKSNNPAKTKLLEDFHTNLLINDIKRTLRALAVVSVMSLQKKTYNILWNNYVNDKYTILQQTTYTTYTTYTTETTADINIINSIDSENYQEVLDKLKMWEFFVDIDNSGIIGRNLELLFPLFSVIHWLDDLQFKEILKISKKINESKKEEEYNETLDVLVYQFIANNKSIFDYISIKELTREFREFYGSGEREDIWINEKWFGRALKRLNLVIDKIRKENGRLVRLNKEKAKEKLKIFKKEEPK